MLLWATVPSPGVPSTYEECLRFGAQCMIGPAGNAALSSGKPLVEGSFSRSSLFGLFLDLQMLNTTPRMLRSGGARARNPEKKEPNRPLFYIPLGSRQVWLEILYLLAPKSVPVVAQAGKRSLLPPPSYGEV